MTSKPLDKRSTIDQGHIKLEKVSNLLYQNRSILDATVSAQFENERAHLHNVAPITHKLTKGRISMQQFSEQCETLLQAVQDAINVPQIEKKTVEQQELFGQRSIINSPVSRVELKRGSPNKWKEFKSRDERQRTGNPTRGIISEEQIGPSTMAIRSSSPMHHIPPPVAIKDKFVATRRMDRDDHSRGTALANEGNATPPPVKDKKISNYLPAPNDKRLESEHHQSSSHSRRRQPSRHHDRHDSDRPRPSSDKERSRHHSSTRQHHEKRRHHRSDTHNSNSSRARSSSRQRYKHNDRKVSRSRDRYHHHRSRDVGENYQDRRRHRGGSRDSYYRHRSIDKPVSSPPQPRTVTPPRAVAVTPTYIAYPGENDDHNGHSHQRRQPDKPSEPRSHQHESSRHTSTRRHNSQSHHKRTHGSSSRQNLPNPTPPETPTPSIPVPGKAWSSVPWTSPVHIEKSRFIENL